ncbi:BtrH N-terminal domain-containing protein [Amycolatopsis sp. NPDC102389]|uniref:BtrH N-terminal domain-containing protein n=1 Tax=Amycolatopsis sp. NPDC102389 TaxID=3363941 RepID=UPI00380E2A23
MSEYALRGGLQPDVSAVTAVLNHHGVEGPDGKAPGEALVFAVSGGIGAGYILWDFAHETMSTIVFGFRARWQYPLEWLKSTMDRLGLGAGIHTTGGKRAAAKRLSADLEAGRPVLVLPDRESLGYWHLPPEMSGGGGHFVVAYGEEDGRVLVDDRNLAPLTVDRKTFDAARGRVGSYKNLLATPQPGEVPDWRAAVRDGLTDCARNLSEPSKSFSLPAWERWAKAMTDERGPKGWPRAFGERRGLVGALFNVWESVTPAGMEGGHLRGLFADALTEAAALLELPALAEQASTWRGIAERWAELAEAAVPASNAEFAWVRGLADAVSAGVREGDAGQDAAAAAGEEMWKLRAHYNDETPFTDVDTRDLFSTMGTMIRDIHTAETAAIRELSEALME